MLLPLAGGVPQPLFDTQIAAMVCGFGESVGYETLVARLTQERIDKTQRFTDWARRPLTERQLRYALSDVSHLRTVYEKLAAELERTGRRSWLDEELAVLTDRATYEAPPEEAWRRLKVRGGNRRFFAILRELAAWRELEADRRDKPRAWVLAGQCAQRDRGPAPAHGGGACQAALGEPADRRECHRQGAARCGQARLGASRRAMPEPAAAQRQVGGAGCAHRPPQGAADLQERGDRRRPPADRQRRRPGAGSPAVRARTCRALQGWRRALFGDDALDLVNGRLALSVEHGALRLLPCGGDGAEDRRRAPVQPVAVSEGG